MPSLLDRIVKAPLDSIECHPDNARRGDVEAIAESLKALDQFAAVVVQKSTNFVVKGNHTLRAVRLLHERGEQGWDTIDAVFIDVDDAKARKILLADNRSSDLGYYDNDALAALLQQFDEDDLDGTLYTSADVDVLLGVVLNHEGDESGGVHEGRTPSERAASYANSTIRSVVLPYSVAEYERVIAACIRLRQAWGLESTAQVVMQLATEAEANLDA